MWPKLSLILASIFQAQNESPSSFGFKSIFCICILMIQKAASFRVGTYQLGILAAWTPYIYIYKFFQSTKFWEGKEKNLSEIFRNILYFNMESSRFINSSMNKCWRHIYIYGTITDLYHGTIMFGKHHKFHVHPYHKHSFFYDVF